MFKLCVLLVPLYRAYAALILADPGDNVTLPCVSSSKYLSWYKQAVGERPEIVASFYKHKPESRRFHNRFREDRRFSVHTEEGGFHLNISNVSQPDSAMYYCGQTSITVTEFHAGIFLALKEPGRLSVRQEPASVSAPAGGSATLNCTVHPGTGDGEHRVYWFRRDPGDSGLGSLFIHAHNSGGGGGRRCVTESPGRSCVYELPKRNVGLSDAGMYHCAVASCGQILLGDGTRLEVEEKQPDAASAPLLCLAAALLASVAVNVALACVLRKKASGGRRQPEGPHPQTSVPEHRTDSQSEEPAALQYAAPKFRKRQSKERRGRSSQDESVYAGLRLSP